MKKIITSGILLLTLFAGFSTSSNAQGVEKGSLIFDVYYGAPNFGKRIISNTVLDNANYRITGSGGVGPLGLRAEYMLADKFGVGIDFIYNSASVDLEYDSLNADGSTFRTYSGSGNMSRIRVQARFNYHFVTTDKLDAYVGVGAGSNTRIWTAKSDDPGYKFRNSSTGTLLPFSMRTAVGMRYYFIPNVGVNAEIGIGGPVVSAGISIKI